MKVKRYSYPALSNRDFGWLRIGGPGLANCMFFVAKAYIYSRLNNTLFIDPTWRKISIGPWLRKEKDKRIYSSLFFHKGITGIRKLLIINGIIAKRTNVVVFSDLGNYFGDLNPHYALVKELFESITRPETIALVKDLELEDKIAIHVRLGDYTPELRINLGWYQDIVRNILEIKPQQQFILFSDGTDRELAPLLTIYNVKRAFFGNAYADMYAISKCKMLIASDSTFSAWGAFLGQKPIIFSRRHFPPVYNGNVVEVVLGSSSLIPDEIKDLL